MITQNYKLSIVILFCDKDYKFLPDLLKNINEAIKINYEIILIDNREKEYNKDLKVNGYHFSIYQFGYNATQVQGRKKGIELATGKYIWFVDADDKVKSVACEKLLNENYDIIVFNSNSICSFRERLLTKEIFNNSGVQLWNKWIKREVLQKVEAHITDNIYGSASEDTLLVIGSLKYGKSILFTTEDIYYYDKERSFCCRPEIKDVEHFKRIINGHDVITNCIINMLSAEDKSKLELGDFLVNDCSFFIDKLAIANKEIIEDCINILSEYFTEDQIIKAWRLFSAGNIAWTKEKWMYTKELLQKRFPDKSNEFIFISKRTYYNIIEGKRVFQKEELFEALPPFKE